VLLLIPLMIAGRASGQGWITYYYNPELVAELTENHVMRYGSEIMIGKSVWRQRDVYTSARNDLIAVVVLKDQLFGQLKNVNSALKQGKQLEAMYGQFGKLMENMGIMFDLTAKKPQYAVFITRFYEKLLERAMMTYNSVSDQALREETDYLMDSYDRQNLLNRMQRDMAIMNGWCLLIIRYLKNAEKKPLIRHVRIFDRWYTKDRAIVNRIMANYKYMNR